MALSNDFVENHIAQWSTTLRSTSRPYRQHWPAHLFRHERVENAAKILTSNQLLSRTEANDKDHLDVAAKAIIACNEEAHNKVRLYFRPRNPTQYRIEGILKPEELYQGDPDVHAPVLIMLIFRSRNILQIPGVSFSSGNMQSHETVTGDGAEFFSHLDFNIIYHDLALDPHSDEGREIIRSRCSEVLLPSPLTLTNMLNAIICRSSAERATLLNFLGDKASDWEDRIITYTEPGLFFSEKSYVDSFDLSETGVRFTLHPRRDSKLVQVQLTIKNNDTDFEIIRGPWNLDPKTTWTVKHDLDPGSYTCSMMIDDCLAYRANHLIDSLPF